jgi:benzaldehyde dehydrogenase (NAD)
MNYNNITDSNFTLDYNSGFSGPAFDLIEPATGQSLGRINAASAEDTHRVVSATKAAQKTWAAVDFDARAKIIRKFAALLEENADLIHGWNARECGSILPKSQWELQASIDQTHMCAART